PFGALQGGTPGFDAFAPPALFRLAGSDPAWTVGMQASDPVVLSFEGGSVNAGSVGSGVEVIDGAGDPVVFSTSMPGGVLMLLPPGGGWPTGAQLRLHGNLQNTSGAALAAPLLLPLPIP
ncbi:MAG: hypothetical protein R3F33_14330, partial [Planctomycetota bacterium]